MGGLIKFPRNGARYGDAQWVERDSAPLTTSAERASLVRWMDLTLLRDGDDDSDGGGGAAA